MSEEAADKMEFRATDDRMTGEILVTPDGPAPSVIEVRDFLSSCGVLFGIKDEQIKEALSRRGQWVAVAFGKEPKPPVDGFVQFSFDTEQPQVKVQADGSADFKDLGIIQNISAGAVLATLIDPVRGEIGRRLDGEVLPCGEPKSATLLPGKNTKISDDGREIVSLIEGMVVFDKYHRVSVENIFTVQGDVGPATGNIDFFGSVAVGGNVCPDFTVKAKEEVIVRGHVEGAIVEGGHGVTIHGGVFGRGKAEIRSKGDIFCRHAQDATFIAGGAIRVKESFLRVEAVSSRAILAEEGAIVGGRVCAPLIKCRDLGSDTDARTIVETGIATKTRMNCARLESQFNRLRSALLTIRKTLNPIREKRNAGKLLNEEEAPIIEKLEKEELLLEVKILATAAELREILSRKDAAAFGRLEVTGTLYPGVIISSVEMERVVREEHKGMNAEAVEGKLKVGGAAPSEAAGEGEGGE